MNTKLIQEKNFITTVWSGGKTQQIFIYPDNAIYENRDFDLRISTATVEVDKSEFTILSGFKRIICPLSADIILKEKQGSEEKLLAQLKPFEFYYFDGNVPIVSYGKCRDFNIMYNDKVAVEVYCINKNSKALELSNCNMVFAFSYKATGCIYANNKNFQMAHFDCIMFKDFGKSINLKTSSETNVLVGALNF